MGILDRVWGAVKPKGSRPPSQEEVRAYTESYKAESVKQHRRMGREAAHREFAKDMPARGTGHMGSGGIHTIGRVAEGISHAMLDADFSPLTGKKNKELFGGDMFAEYFPSQRPGRKRRK